MSTLLVQTLVDNLTQEITLKNDRRYHIGAIIPYLYFHNPVGTFTIELIRDDAAVFSKSFTYSEVQTSLGTASNYAHVFFPVIPDSPLILEKGSYTLKLSASGYSNSASSFVGWVQQFEDVQNVMDYLPLNQDENSLAFRVKEFKEGISA